MNRTGCRPSLNIGSTYLKESNDMYNYFIKTSDKKVHKFPKPMNWMSADTFGSFLVEVKAKNPKAKYLESWRTKARKKGKKNGTK